MWKQLTPDAYALEGGHWWGTSFSVPMKKSRYQKASCSESSSLNPLHRHFSHHLHLLAVLDRDSSPLPGDGSWSEDASGQHWCVEGHQPLDWWCRVYKLHGEEFWAAQAYPLHPIPILTLILEWVPRLHFHGSDPFSSPILCQIPSFFLTPPFLPSHLLPGP